MIGRRIATASAAIPLVLAAAWLGGLVWAAFVTVLALVAVWEMILLLNGAGAGSARPREAAAAALCVCAGAAAAAADASLWPLWLAAPAAGLAVTMLLFLVADGRRPLADFQAAWSASLYPVFAMTFLIGLRAGPHGLWRTLAALAIVWVGDAAAFAVGSLLGGPTPFPGVSPNKTVTGSLGGLAATTATAWLFSSWLGVDPRAAAALGLTAGILAQFGDLAESLLKRRAGVKDSGALLPGHGGILDRFDGVLIAVPWMWLFLTVWH